MTALPPLSQMDVEWRAWRSICHELKLVAETCRDEGGNAADAGCQPDPVDLNGDNFDMLFKAIRRWGEELVALRSDQPDEVVEKALREHQGAYPVLVES